MAPEEGYTSACPRSGVIRVRQGEIVSYRDYVSALGLAQ
jgi:ketosteroid isomerase-like protein